MANDLNIRIKINSDTKQLEITQDGFEKIRQKAETASDPIDRLTKRIADMGHAAVGIVAIKEAVEAVVISGIRLNSQMEQMKLGMASLIAVNSSNTTAMGKHVTAVEKFIMAQTQASESVELLRKANVQTPATLAQVTEGYQAALGPALRLGLSAKQTVEYVRLMTMAAAAMGAPMEQIAQESRALLSGEIDMNAQVARNLQITNEQVKLHTQQGDLYEWLTQKLGDFAAGGEAMANSWAGISSNLEDTSDTIRKNATQNIFDNLKQDGLDLQKKLSDNSDEISAALSRAFTNAYLVAEPAFTNIYLAGSIAFENINILLNTFTGAFNDSINGMNSKYRELGFFDYLSLGTIVAIEGLRQLGDVGLSVITFLGKMMNGFAQITLSAFAGINTGLGKLADLTGAGGEEFYASAAFWNRQVNALKQDGLKIDQAQQAILGDMSYGLDRLNSSYKKLAAIKSASASSTNNDQLLPGGRQNNENTGGKKGKTAAQIEAEELRAVQQRLDLQKAEQLEYYNTIGDYASVWAIKVSDEMQQMAVSGVLSDSQMIEVFNVKHNQFLVDDKKRNGEKLSSEKALYASMLNLSGDWYTAESVKIGEQYAEWEKAGADRIALEEWLNQAISALDDKRGKEQKDAAAEWAEYMNSTFASALESQIALLDGTNAWAEGLDGTAKSISAVADKLVKLSKLEITAEKDRLKSIQILQKGVELAGDDKEKLNQLSVAFAEEEAARNDALTRQQINGYAALAGAMSGFFQEGSEGAKVLQTAQAGLAAVSAVMGIAQQAALPFPANIAAMTATAATVFSFLGSIGIGGGGGGSAVTEDFAENREKIETTYEPMTDRLDRQIELLESIDRQGSASQLGVELAGVSFARDYKLWIEDTLEHARLGDINAAMTKAQTEAIVSAVETASGVDMYRISGSDDKAYVTLQTDVLRESYNMIKALVASYQVQWGVIGQKAVTSWDSNGHAQMMGQNLSDINALQNIIADWASGVIGSMDDLKGASEDFKGYFDDITGSMYYETSRLSDAFRDIDALRGERSAADYLQSTISDIDAVQSFFNDDVFSLLMSNDVNDIDAQIAKIEELSVVTGETFDAGARQALDYLESIQLVAEAMTTSRNNIADWASNFKSDSQIAAEQAAKLGVTLATSTDELSRLFARLATDVDGLSDAELDMLNANRELLESYRGISDEIGSAITSITGTTAVTLGDAASMINTAGSDNYQGIIETIQSAYDYEKSLLDEKHAAELKQLDNMKSTLGDLKKFSDGLLYENRSTAIPNEYASRYLDKSITDYKNALRSGGDASDALASIKSYSGAYINYLKATSATDADYNFGVASLANRLKSIGGNEATLSTIDKSIAGLNSTFDASVAALKDDAVGMLGQLDTTMTDQLTALDTIGAATDVQTQQIVDVLTGAGIKLADGWQPVANYDEYTKIIGLYLDKGIIASQITTDGIDYWVGEMSKFSTDAIGSMIDSIIAEQSAMAAVTDAVTQVASASESGLIGISDSVAGLTDSTLASIGGVSGAVDSLTDTTLSGLSSLTGVIDGLSSSNSVIGADVTTSIGSITGAVDALSNSTVSALGGYSDTTVSGLESVTGAVGSASTTATTGTQTLAGLLAAMATAGHTSDLFASLNAVTNAMGSGLSQRIAAQTGSITAMDDNLGDSFNDLIGSITGDTRSMASAMVSAIGLSTGSIITQMIAANNVIYSAESLQTDAITTQTNTLAAAINLQTGTLSEVIRISNSDMTVADYINSLYEQGLGRKADAGGYEFWMNEVSSGKLAIGDLMRTFSYAAEVNGATFDAANISLPAAGSSPSVEIIAELRAVRAELKSVKDELYEIKNNSTKIETNTRTSRVAI